MPAVDTEGQFKFLLCCIKHSAAGKVNFDNVAAEMEIVSKAAAAKRYERLLKAHDISPTTPRKAAATKKGEEGSDEGVDPETPASKKRKRGGGAKAAAAVKKDPEAEAPVKQERKVKKEVKEVKQEESSEEVEVKGESEDEDYISN